MDEQADVCTTSKLFKQLLTGANPKFIRCINPRPKGIAAPDTMGKRFNLQRVLVQVRFPLRFRICVIMIRTADELSRNVGESQPLPWF